MHYLSLEMKRAHWATVRFAKPIAAEFASPSHRLSRADLEISGIYHGESSYEGRIFFNNPTATVATPRTARSGYAGAFRARGHGRQPAVRHRQRLPLREHAVRDAQLEAPAGAWRDDMVGATGFEPATPSPPD